MEVDYKAYEGYLDRAIQAIHEFSPEFLVVSFGVDTSVHDPLGIFAMQNEDYLKIGSRVGIESFHRLTGVDQTDTEGAHTGRTRGRIPSTSGRVRSSAAARSVEIKERPCHHEQKATTRWIPVRSPITVLASPMIAYLTSSEWVRGGSIRYGRSWPESPYYIRLPASPG